MRVFFLTCLVLPLAAQNHTLTLTVQGFKSDQGEAAIAVHKDASTFPMKAEKAVASQRVPIKDGVVTLAFPKLAPGVYAVAVFHDVNGNKKLDTNFLGIPKEPTGASRDPRPRMGPPKFSDASFELQSDLAIRITLQ